MSYNFKTNSSLEYFVFKESVYTAYVKPNFSKYLGIGTIDPFYDSDILVNNLPRSLGTGIVDDFLDDDVLSLLLKVHADAGITPILPSFLGLGVIDNVNERDIYTRLKLNSYIGIGIQGNYNNFEKEINAYIQPKHLGLAVDGGNKPFEKEIYSYIAPKHLGIAVDGEYHSFEKEIYSYSGQKHLGIAVDGEYHDFEKEIYSYPGQKYLGIAVKDTTNEKEIVSYPGQKYLGIAVKDTTNEKEIYSHINPTHLGIAVLSKKAEKEIMASGYMLGPFLRFVCDSNTIEVQQSNDPKNLLNNLKSFNRLLAPKNVQNPGNWVLEARATDKNNPGNPDKEKPRLLTHLIFDPITKPRSSVYYLTYTLEIEVARTPEKDHADFYMPDQYKLPNTYEYHSTIKTKTWYIDHQLGFIPNINVFVDNKIYLNYTYSHLNENTTILQFDTDVSGVAQLG